MTLIINNQEVQQLLTMEDTIAALEQGYLQLAAGRRSAARASTSAYPPAIRPGTTSGAPWREDRPPVISPSA